MGRDALIIVDMQVGLLASGARFDAPGLVQRLNTLAADVRARDGAVIFIQHESADGVFARGAPGWRILPELARGADDVILAKTTCDSFHATDLDALLRRANAGRVIITGCATDFYVDTTVRASALRGFDTWAPSDGHTTAGRPHLKAPQIIAHHNYVWSDFIGANGPAKVVPIAEMLGG